ncbi:MAG: hypothetical protein ORN85_01505, partial [Sediminibacterium sp.]|nr:hypothetical protein [Sediminibacterium sp.]
KNVSINQASQPTYFNAGDTTQLLLTGQNDTIKYIRLNGTKIRWYSSPNMGSILDSNQKITGGSQTYYGIQLNAQNCPSFPRLSVRVLTYNRPARPYRPLVRLLNNASNQTIAYIQGGAERLNVLPYDTPVYYLIFAQSLSTSNPRRIILDTIYRQNKNKLDTLTSAVTSNGLSYNLNNAGVLNNEPLYFYIQGVNLVDSSSRSLHGTKDSTSSTDSLFIPARNQFNSFKTVSFNVRTSQISSGSGVPTDQVMLPSFNSLGSHYSIEFFYRFQSNSSSGNAPILELGSGSVSGSNRALFISQNGTQNAINVNQSGTNNTINIPNFSSWNHYAFCYDATNKILRFYLNGVLNNTFTNINALNSTNTSVNYFLGTAQTSGNEGRAMARNLRIWNTQRSNVDIANNMTSTITGFENNLVYWLELENNFSTRKNSQFILNNTSIQNGSNSVVRESNASTVISQRLGSLDTSAQYFYDANNKIIYLSHRTLNLNEVLQVKVFQQNGTTLVQDWVTTNVINPTTNFYLLPSSFFNGIISARIYNFPNTLFTYTNDTITTVSNPPTITKVSGSYRNATLQFSAPADTLINKIISYQAYSSSGNTGVKIASVNSGANAVNISNLDLGVTYQFRMTATNSIGISDTSSFYVTPIVIFDTAGLQVNFCEDSGFVYINPKQNGLRYFLYISSSNGGSTIPVTSSTISQMNQDSIIRTGGYSVGKNYQFKVTVSNIADTTANGATTITTNLANSFLIDTIKITSALRYDTLCSANTNPVNISVQARGGRLANDSNYSGGTALYSYQWYISSTQSNVSGTPFSVNPSYSSTTTLAKDSVGNRFYYVLIGDSVRNSTICQSYRKRRSAIIEIASSFILPSLDTPNALKTTDTACLLGTKNFSTLSINISNTNAFSNYRYQWYRLRSSGSPTLADTLISGATGATYTPTKDSLKGFNFYQVRVANGNAAACIATSAISKVLYVIDTPSRPVVVATQSFALNVNDTLRFLSPTPSSTFSWYNTLTNGTAFNAPFNTQLKNDTLYYVVQNRAAIGSYICSSTPRVSVKARVLIIPSRPNTPTVNLFNDNNNQAFINVALTSPNNTENINAATTNAPDYYNIYIQNVQAQTIRTIRLDSVLRNSAKFDTLFSRNGITSGLNYFIYNVGIGRKEKFRVFLRAGNVAGISAFSPPGINNGQGNLDSSYIAAPVSIGAYRTTGFNSRIELAGSIGNNIRIPANNLGLTNRDFTLELWYRANGTQTNQWGRIFDINSSTTFAATNNEVFIAQKAEAVNGRMAYKFFGQSGYNTFTLDYTNWHHYTYVQRGSNVFIYIDGVLQFTNSGALISVAIPNNSLSGLGITPFNDNTPNGIWQDFRIWRVARTDSQILQSFTQNLSNPAINTNNLLYWLPLGNENNEGLITTVIPRSTRFAPNELGTLSDSSFIQTNATTNPNWFFDSAARKIFLSHRTLNAGESFRYRLINPDGSINITGISNDINGFTTDNITNFLNPTLFWNNTSDVFVTLANPSNSTAFRNGVIEACIWSNTNNACINEPIGRDTIRTISLPPTITKVSGGFRSATINFNRPIDTGYSTTRYRIIALPGNNFVNVNSGSTSGTIINLNPGTYNFVMIAINALGSSDTSVMSSSLKIFDSTVYTPIVCDTTMTLYLNTKDSNLFYTITLVPNDLTSNTVLTGRIKNPNADTAIYIANLKNGVNYATTIRFSNNDNIVGNNGTSTVTNTTFNTAINRIQVSVIFRNDTLCTTQASANNYNLTVQAGANANGSSASGTLYAYQWYINNNNSTTGGTLLPGQNTINFAPIKDSLGRRYYYVIVGDSSTNNTYRNTCRNYKFRSEVAGVALGYRQPIIVTQPDASNNSYCINTASNSITKLFVRYSPANILTKPDSIRINTKWYRRNVRTSVVSLFTINVDTITPDVSIADTSLYFVVVKNGDGTTNACNVTSNNSGNINIIDGIRITMNLTDSNRNYCRNQTPATISVSATGGTGSNQYFWYQSTQRNSATGTLISGASNNTFVPSTTQPSANYYYVKVLVQGLAGCSDTVTGPLTGLITINTLPVITNINLPNSIEEYCQSPTFIADTFKITTTP